ncbi:DUF4241 domain-containing protein [Kribbella qitaiheensis]|uniref:DUF4241 domain-containing protein n=1 Tax=Kribbella qitaiheensis TaxID=1544730 RepID=A0A7G6X0P2_9ACTN|nr:DUF4241 domain-containing protein [Kribbella qitaiheensis]QNE19807.1 DUF4241 domain-containing protein [Kribbella qitaiheensis]
MPAAESFRALRPGPVLVDDETWSLTVHDLGILRVPSGRLEASDPFVNLGEGQVIDVPPGDYPVRVTVADVSDEQDGSHLREAYLSVVLADGEAADVVPATRSDEELPVEEYWVVAVDAGTVGFADAEAIPAAMPAGDWYEEVFDNDTDDSWFSLMDSEQHLIAGCANIVMPAAKAAENVVLAHSGWGDGVYPVVCTVDADGKPLAIHIDLLVVGDVDEDEPDT